MKTIIWFLGSNACGKTTQSKLLHEQFSNGDKKVFVFDEDSEKIKFTVFGNSIGHVGVVGDNQCTGTDTVNSKKSVEMSMIYCLNACDIVIIDGIMATAQWSKFINQFPKENIETFVILLQFPTLEQNLRRICERRAYKKIDDGGNDGADIYEFDMIVDSFFDSLDEKTYKNVGSKFKGFKNMFEKVKKDFTNSIEIDASKDMEQIKKDVFLFLSTKSKNIKVIHNI